MATPLLALTVGDPAGIGPEIVLGALQHAEVRSAARLLVIGPGRLRPTDVPAVSQAEAADLRLQLPDGAAVWIESEAPEHWELGRVQRACGQAAHAALRIGHELAFADVVDALVTAPVSKEALHLAGVHVEGQTELLGRWCEVNDHQMLAIAGQLRILLLTRHLPLRLALRKLDGGEVLRHLKMLDKGLRELGFESPRLGLAGLNPHAGEGGVLGREEIEILEPAKQKAIEAGLDVTGPISPDTVFAQAVGGRFDGVLALYHDQAFIPIKLLGEGRAMTLLLGFPYLRLSPAHGTGFDIVGRSLARHDDLRATIIQAAEWGAARRRSRSLAHK
jgi:4-hydroxythreonine-4-phosphate dehydrogenase